LFHDVNDHFDQDVKTILDIKNAFEKPVAKIREALFPTGQSGEFHPRKVRLPFSEYVHLLNQDSGFCKTWSM